MGSYGLKGNFLKVNNTNYYRSNGIQLGHVGKKNTSIFSVNRVDAQINIPAPKMKVKYGETFVMDEDSATEIAGSVSFKGLSLKAFKKKLIEGDLKLARYYMKNRVIENAIEDSPRLIESIKSFGRDARVVSDVWIVVDAEIIEKTKGGGTLGFKNSVSGNASLEGETTMVLSTGTVIAYMLQKINWEEKQKKNWSKIDYLSEDPWGLN